MKHSARRVWTASNAVVLAYGIRTAFALALLGPFGLELASMLNAQASSPEPRGDDGILDLLQLVLRTLPSQAQSMALTAAVYALLAPLLMQLVLESLTRPNTLSVNLRVAWQRYPPALLLSAMRWLLLGLIAAIAAVSCAWLPAHSSPGLEGMARFVPLSLCALAALWIATAHDLCASELARSRSRFAAVLLRGARASRPTALLVFGAFGLVSSAFFALGDAASRPLTIPLAAIAIQQTTGLLGALVRAQWLALTDRWLAIPDRSFESGPNEPT